MKLGVALLCALASGTAAADTSPSFNLSPTPLLPEKQEIDLSYVIDGGMIPFFGAPMAGRLALDTWVEPRSKPLLYSANEGGAAKASWEVPAYAVSGLASDLASEFLQEVTSRAGTTQRGSANRC